MSLNLPYSTKDNMIASLVDVILHITSNTADNINRILDIGNNVKSGLLEA